MREEKAVWQPSRRGIWLAQLRYRMRSRCCFGHNLSSSSSVRIDLLRGQWRHSALRQSRAGSGEETELGGAFDPCVDFTAQGAEIDRLGQKRLGAALKRLALGFRIAVGSDHDDRDVRPQGLRLA